MSAEIAISPAKVPAGSLPPAAGNESTSVDLSTPRKRRFRARNSEFPAIKIFTVPRSFANRLARKTKRSTVDRLKPGIRFRKMTKFARPMPGSREAFEIATRFALPLNESRRGNIKRRHKLFSGGDRFVIRCTKISAVRGSRFWIVLLQALRSRQQRHLLLGGLCFMLIVGADYPLNQVVANHIALIEVNKSKTLNVLQDVDGFEQAAAPRVGQIDLGNVAGNDSLGIEAQAGHEHLHLF